MSIKNESTVNEPVGSSLQPVATDLRQIPLSKIRVLQEEYSFREQSELEWVDLKSLAEDIAEIGLTTPVLVQDCGEKGFLMLNGHRRYFALKFLIEKGVDGFDADMLVPANVIAESTSEIDALARAASSNIQHQSLSALGRIRRSLA